MATLDLTGSDHTVRLPTTFETRTRLGIFHGKSNHRYGGLAVVCQETSPGTWSVTTYPGLQTTVGGGDDATVENDINAADFVFYGGDTYTVTDANLVTALTTAGYTI